MIEPRELEPLHNLFEPGELEPLHNLFEPGVMSPQPEDVCPSASGVNVPQPDGEENVLQELNWQAVTNSGVPSWRNAPLPEAEDENPDSYEFFPGCPTDSHLSIVKFLDAFQQETHQRPKMDVPFEKKADIIGNDQVADSDNVMLHSDFTVVRTTKKGVVESAKAREEEEQKAAIKKEGEYEEDDVPMKEEVAEDVIKKEEVAEDVIKKEEVFDDVIKKEEVVDGAIKKEEVVEDDMKEEVAEDVLKEEEGEQGLETPMTENELDDLLKDDGDDAMELEEEEVDDDTYDPDWEVATEAFEEEEAAEEAERIESGIQLLDDLMAGETTEEEVSGDWDFEDMSESEWEQMPISSRTRAMTREFSG